MLASLGNLSLWLSLIFSILQFIVSKKNNNLPLLNISVLSLLFTSLLSFFLLMYLYIVSDFTVSNVFENSHTTKPLIYKIAAVWGNHEGSMLMWILVLVIFNYFIFKLLNKKNSTFIAKSLEIQAIIIFGFILFTIFTSNPFEKIIPPQPDGLGFNPILQDPALAIHPPLLYIGYVGFSAAFSMSIAALTLNSNEKILWYYYMKPFVLAAWTFLTIGIALGSFWAYYELGWGGWWFWDPVENASFMPWLIGTALLHSLIIVEKRKSLKNWVLLLSILAFLLSVVGTFLVRSGILTSVHTFALDPTRGLYILIFTAFLGAYSFILFAKNSKKFEEDRYFKFFSKEGSILLNNIIMLVVCFTVLLGTIYPLIIEALTNNKISVGEPYYNSTVIPIVIPGILIMGIGPILSWGSEKKLNLLKKIFPNILVTGTLTLVIFTIYKSYSIIALVGIILAFWIISNNLSLLIKKDKSVSTGMLVSHLGIGLLILGITGSSVWQKEKILNMNIKNEFKIEKYNVIFENVEELRGKNYIALRGNFSVFDHKNIFITKLRPENRYYPITNNFTTEASIHSNLTRDLYIVLGEGNEKDGWTIRMYYNPLVAWIWIGSFIIFVGGIISMNINFKKTKNI